MAGIVFEDTLVAWIELQQEAIDVGAKVYPWAEAPQGTATKPYVLYQRISGGRMGHLSGRGGVGHPRIQLDFFGRDYEAVRDLAAAIRVKLDGFSGDMQGRTVQSIIVHDDFDQHGGNEDDAQPRHGTEDAEHRFSLDLTIWFKE